MVLSKMERTENTAADAAVRAAAADMLSQKSENRRILLLKSRHTENFVINICYFIVNLRNAAIRIFRVAIIFWSTFFGVNRNSCVPDEVLLFMGGRY